MGSSSSSGATHRRRRRERSRPCCGAARSTSAICSEAGSPQLGLARRHYVERSPDPAAYCEFFRETFGPVAGLYAALADRPDTLAALDRDFLEFATRSNEGPPGGPAEYRYEYLLVVGRKPGS